MSPSEDSSAALLSFSATPVLACVAALSLLAFVSKHFSSPRDGRKEPPGPRPLPLLGNLLQLDLPWLNKTLCRFAKQYGSVFTIYLGTRKVVVLAGYKTVKEALVGHAMEFGERFVQPMPADMTSGHGIIFANGESWKELRRFALSTLRDFGMGKKLTQDKVLEECSNLIPVLESHQGQPFDTTSPMSWATSNIICSIVYGNRFEYSDPRFSAMVRRNNESIRNLGSLQIQLYNMFPRLFRWVKLRQCILDNRDETIKDVKELLRQRKEKLDAEMCTGVVDCFFVRQQKEEEAGRKQGYFNEENMIFMVNNLFAAGTDTSATTLRWALLLMAKYPQIQEHVYEELSRVLESRPIDIEDRKNLPYTNAVIHEVQRFANIVPMSILHQTSQDVTFQGYFIQKGTVVIPLLSSALYDENEWETPNTFNPSHFLDKDGNFVKRDALIPFSAGRRVCLGEGLARMELFLFFTCLLQHFRFTPPPGISEDELDLSPVVGFTTNPAPHRLCAIKRQ